MKLKNLILGITAAAVLMISLPVSAKKNCRYMIGTGKYQVECTAYCDCEQPTASGELVRVGICAFAPELMHCTVAVYLSEDSEPFYVEVKDTGSKRIREGEVIDIWIADYDECIEWGRKKVWIEVIDAEG